MKLTGGLANVLHLLLLALMLPAADVFDAQAQDERDVVVNRTRLESATVRALEKEYGVRVLDGRYWYDVDCGAWGFEGGPTVGFILPGLDLGGTLRPDASDGTTGVFINGRELHVQDAWALQQILGAVIPGRYWLDRFGNVGNEGGPAFLNLAAMARQAGAGAGNPFYRSGNTDYGSGGSGGTSYVMGADWSVIIDN